MTYRRSKQQDISIKQIDQAQGGNGSKQSQKCLLIYNFIYAIIYGLIALNQVDYNKHKFNDPSILNMYFEPSKYTKYRDVGAIFFRNLS